MALRVNSDSFASEVLSANVLTLVDFYSDSCVPCKRLSPVLAEIEEQYAGEVKLVKVNINFDASLAEQYEVQSVPTLIFFKGGEEIARLNGSLKKGEITENIEKLK